MGLYVVHTDTSPNCEDKGGYNTSVPHVLENNADGVPALQDTLFVEQESSSTAVNSHKSQETLSDSIELKRNGRVERYEGSLEEGVENTTPSKFGYESFEGERLAIFSGPNGTSISVGDYEKVLMIAAGSGIAVQLLYPRELVRRFNSYQVRTREIR